MHQETQGVSPLEPPADVPESQRSSWFAVPTSDPVVKYLTANFWDRPEQPSSWEAARLSRAVYIYREKATQWATVAKFCAAKTSSAEKYANREFTRTQRARATGLTDGHVRAIRPLAPWQGVLFLEYVDGLTLENIIAARRNRPGTLLSSLERVAVLLATLHTHGIQPDAQPDFQPGVAYARKLIDELTRYGVLQGEPVVRDGVIHLIDHWAAIPAMGDFVPACTHGDATTSNFIFPWDGGIVAIDWERLRVADPAADLGRLMAEVSHSIKQHGGDVAEAIPLVQHLADAYRQALSPDWDADALIERARFYQASSTLRIARNGWVSRLDRAVLVAQALALLAWR